VHQENAGLAAARMAGVAATTSPYVTALDADDLEAPGALTALVDALDADPEAAVAWGDVQNFADDRTYRRLGRTLDPWLITYVNELPADAMVRREALLDAGGWQLRGGYEDWDLWMALAERGARGIHVPVLTGYYRVRGTRMLAGAAQRHGAILSVLRERHPRLFAERSANRRRSPAPLRCKLLLPLIDRLPLGDYTKHRLFRLVNRPSAALRARL
jgi:glycosyltransferase involved in cell wall biosynthesis